MMDRHELDFDDGIKEHRRDAGRSGEEIERLTVDENLNDLDRTKLYLQPNAHQLQQGCALENLPKIFHDYSTAAYRGLFPMLTTCLDTYNSQLQIAAAQAFVTIAEDSKSTKEVGVWFLPTVLHMLDSNRTQEVARMWLKTLCVIIPALPQKTILDELVHLAIAKGESQQSVQSRIVCCGMLGAIAPLLKSEDIDKFFLPKAMGLCQDTDTEVRICMCEQLNKIARVVGVESTKEKILPELFELLEDEELAVQNVAVDILVQMLDFLPANIRQTKIMPYLRLFCPPLETQVVVMALPRVIGELMCKIVFDLSDEDFQPLMEAYKCYVQHPNEEIRKISASNFPAVVKAVGARKYANVLHVLYLELVQDPSNAVRAICASSLNEIAKLLGKKRASSYLKDPLVSLLEDSSLEVQKAILQDLHHILGHFAVGTVQQKAALFESLLFPLLHVEKNASNAKQWRLQLCLLRVFAQMPEYFSSDQIYENFVPICFCYMVEGVMPVKAAATLALATFIRNNQKAHQRYDLSTRVVKEFGNGKSYWSRMVFIEFCENMLKVSSSRMFRDLFLDHAITTLQDPVPSVRMRACLLLPLLKHAIKLPEDVGVMEKINHLTTQRLNDNVRDVAAAAQRVADGFKQSLRSAINDREVANIQVASQEEMEKIDKQREEEEWNMLSKEEQDEKRKIDEMLQRLKLERSTCRKTVGLTAQSVACSQQDAGRRSAADLSRSVAGTGARANSTLKSTTADAAKRPSVGPPVQAAGSNVKRAGSQSTSATSVAPKLPSKSSFGNGNSNASATLARPASPAVTDDSAMAKRNSKAAITRKPSSS